MREALNEIAAGGFAQGGWQQVQPLLDNLWHHDHFMVAADFAAYAATQRRIDHAFGDHAEWTRRAVLNTARVGWFSSDRAIRGYARDIWQVATN